MRDRLLIRHFLWRFFEHDLVSPNADRHELFAIVGGTIVTINLFLAVVVAAKYQFENFMPPGLISIRSVDDRFLFVSTTLLLAALAAVAQWDALVLDARDTAVLGVLPLPKSVIVRTKFAATALFGLAVVLASSLPPTALRLAAIPMGTPVGMPGALWLTLTNGVATFAAGVFGFVAVLAVRETIFAVLGAKRFRSVSAIVQGGLVIVLITDLLLLPWQTSSMVRPWLARGGVPVWTNPAFWFVGLHEMIGGRIFDDLPRVEPERFLIVPEQQATLLYRRSWPLYHDLAWTAVMALIVVAMLATLACLWNSRRLPTTIGANDRRGGVLQRAFRHVAVRVVATTPLEQAGFFLAIQTLSRRASHRIPLAGAFAIGLALVVIAATGRSAGATATGAILVVPLLFVGTVTTAFRHVTRLPSELRGSSGFILAWPGQPAAFIRGIKRAGWVVIVWPTLALMALWHSAILGPRLALLHAIVGVGFSMVLMELLFVSVPRVPFASAHVPEPDAKSHAIMYGVALTIVSVIVAGIEASALESPARFIVFLTALFALFAIVRAGGRAARDAPIGVDTEDMQALPTQRLNLAQ